MTVGVESREVMSYVGVCCPLVISSSMSSFGSGIWAMAPREEIRGDTLTLISKSLVAICGDFRAEFEEREPGGLGVELVVKCVQ